MNQANMNLCILAIATKQLGTDMKSNTFFELLKKFNVNGCYVKNSKIK